MHNCRHKTCTRVIGLNLVTFKVMREGVGLEMNRWCRVMFGSSLPLLVLQRLKDRVLSHRRR